MIGSSGLNLREGVLLGHALVQAAAEGVDGRILFIKGPRQSSIGLRDAGVQSVDVDVLVHPADFERVRQELAQAGWRVQVPLTAARVLPLHSLTLTRAGWPCEIDLHHRFPGLLAPPIDAFKALWETREVDYFAGKRISVPSVAGFILIRALHLERDGDERAAEVIDLVHRCRRMLDEETCSRLAALAQKTGSSETLNGFLEVIGVAAPPSTATSCDLEAWKVRRSSPGVAGMGWLYTVRRAPLTVLPALAWRGLMSTEMELRKGYPQAPAGARGVWLARWWRLRRALRDLPRAVRMLRTARKP